MKGPARGLVLGAVVFGGLGGAGAWAEELRLKLSAPGTLVGDGASTVVLRLAVSPPEAAGPVDQIGLDVDAGRVGKVRALGQGVFEIEFTPPRVAGAHELKLAAVLGGALRSSSVSVQVTPPPVVIAEVTSGGPLELTGPDHLVLGRSEPAPLSLKQTTRPPRLFANVGSLSTPVPGPTGRWQAIYTPPVEKFPQVALIAAVTDDGIFDWLVIPLHGQGVVDTRSKPLAHLSINVAGVEYGPVRADGTGHATLVVTAPPGVPSGRSTAVDPIGNVKEAPLDLGTPPFSRLLAVCVDDGLRLLAVDARGQPAETERFVVSASAGTLGPPVKLEPGLFAARLQPQPDGAELRASLAGDPRSSGTCRYRSPGEAPGALRVSLDRAQFQAGSGPLAVRVELLYPGARAPRHVDVALSADLGTIRRTDGGGSWQLPDRLEGHARATVRARVAGSPLVAEATVALLAAPPSRLVVERPAGRLVADGASRTGLTVGASDPFGNPVPLTHVAAQGRGAFVALPARPDGRVAFSYTPPKAKRGDVDEITVRDLDSGVRTSLALPLTAARRPLALTARLGYLTNFGKISAPLVAVDADYRLPWLHRNLSIGVEAGFYHASYRANAAGGGDPVELSIAGVPLFARIDYQIPLGRAAISLGVGGGVIVPRVSVSSPTTGDQANSRVVGLLPVTIGADVEVGRGRLALAVGYFYAPDGGGAISGSFGGLHVTAGYRLEL